MNQVAILNADGHGMRALRANVRSLHFSKGAVTCTLKALGSHGRVLSKGGS